LWVDELPPHGLAADPGGFSNPGVRHAEGDRCEERAFSVSLRLGGTLVCVGDPLKRCGLIGVELHGRIATNSAVEFAYMVACLLAVGGDLCS
jgi:hypothetical protein